MQSLSVEPILVLVLVQSTWTMLAVLVVRQDSLTALEALLSAVQMVTQKMQEYDVKVMPSSNTIRLFANQLES